MASQSIPKGVILIKLQSKIKKKREKLKENKYNL